MPLEGIDELAHVLSTPCASATQLASQYTHDGADDGKSMARPLDRALEEAIWGLAQDVAAAEARTESPVADLRRSPFFAQSLTPS